MGGTKRALRAGAVVALALVLTTLTACDGGIPNSMPVNQDGENVLFVLNQNEVEVHIQISIDPDTNAQKFAWLIPIQQIPEFEVGSQPLFDALLQSSVPVYQLNQTFEQCGENGISGGLTGRPGAPRSSRCRCSGSRAARCRPRDPARASPSRGARRLSGR